MCFEKLEDAEKLRNKASFNLKGLKITVVKEKVLHAKYVIIYSEICIIAVWVPRLGCAVSDQIGSKQLFLRRMMSLRSLI